LLVLRRAESSPTGRKGDRHGQGSDAQQQGKEETEGRQEPQEGWCGALAVCLRQDARGPEPRQEELAPGSLRSAAHRRRRSFAYFTAHTSAGRATCAPVILRT